VTVIPFPAAPKAARVLPHNLDVEASVLGGVILRNDILPSLSDLETEDFYDHRHRVVWQAIRNLESRLRPIDVVTLENEIEKQGKLEAIGGISFLGELATRVPTADNVCAYRDDVRLHARNRRAILAINDALEAAWNWPHDPRDLVSDIGGRLARIEETSAPQAPKPTYHLISIDEAYDELSRLSTAPIYPTPFPALNNAIGFGGLLGTQVYTVAAGTGRGKTSWVAEVGSFAAQSVPVLVSVHELGPGYFVARRAAGQLGVHSNDIIRGSRVTRADIHNAMPFGDRMVFLHRPTLEGLSDATDHMAQKFGVAPLLIVDYLQKLADEIASRQQRPDLRLATNEASTALLTIGERTGAAIIAVSSIGRGKRALEAPRKLAPYQLVEVAKESGAVEYDGAAMIVLSLSNDSEGDERIATMTLAKARFGRECHIDARYHGARGSWRDVGEVEIEDRSERTDKPAPKPRQEAEDREDHVKRAILRELERAPARTKSGLFDRVRGCRKDLVRALFARMIDEGAVVAIGGYFTPSPVGRQILIEGQS
jgi:replicative DNA helicase